MGATTYIEWTDSTWNPVGGCSIKSPGCINCYAQQLSGTRLSTHPLYAGTTTLVKGKPFFNGKLTERALDHDVWSWPVRWRGSKTPKMGPGMPSTIFVGDMSDVFHEDRSFEAIDRVIAPLIYSQHVGQLLTKRPEVMELYFEGLRNDVRWLMFPHPLFAKPNFDPMVATFLGCVAARLWVGCSVERQREADERRESMRRLSGMGFTTFVSYEPTLGPVDWKGWEFLDQIISGGESGKNDPRPSSPYWHRATRDFCERHGIAYFFKQWGSWGPEYHAYPDTIAVLENGDTRPGAWLDKVGPHERFRVARMGRHLKAANGRVLDGLEWSQFPRVDNHVAPIPALV